VVTDYGTYWRVEIRTANNSTGNLTLYFQCFAAINTTGNGTSNNATTGSTVIYGAQLEEAASFATSYIPNGAATSGATRTADLAGVSIQAFPFNASEGTLVASGTFVAPAQSGVSTMVSLSSGLYAESINIYRQNSQMLINSIDDNNTQAGYTVSAPGNLTKAAIAYKLNDTNAAVNGTAQTTDTTSTVPTVNTLDIGRMWSNAFVASGWIRQITYLPRRISNTELQARTV
jgi:hypothetical protein